MQDSVKTILNILNRMGYKAYYSGEKCRNEIFNEILKINFKSNQINIVTNAPIEDIKKIFPNAVQNEKNKMIFKIDFANEKFQLESYHYQNYYKNEGGKEEFLEIPIIDYAPDLEQDFYRKVFTINCVAKDAEGNNYFFKSGEKDIENRIIRTVDEGKDIFYHYPVRTLQAFTLMAQTGFDIDKQVLKNIRSTMRYMRNLSSELIGKELRKIMRGKFAMKAFQAMHKIGILNSRCIVIDKDGNEKKVNILKSLHDANIDIFNVLGKFKINSDIELELWSLLFDNEKTAMEELQKFNCFSESDLKTICWLIHNRDLFDYTNDDIMIRNHIYNSLTNYEQKQGIHYLKNLIVKACRIYKTTNDDKPKEERTEITKRVLYNVCCRPYFSNQLTWDISLKDKETLIPLLLNEQNYPITDKETDNFIIKNGCKKIR